MCMKWKLLTYLAFAFLCLVLPVQAYAHGARIDYTVDMEIDIIATYDSGQPMAGAQIVVYAPDDLSTPWLTGVCDEEGRFSFTPDSSRIGTWDVQVRQAGHGDIIHIPVGEGTTASGSSDGYSVGQIALMSVCGIWGIAGTALYVLRRRA